MDSKVTITAELDKGSILVIETTSVVNAAAAATEAVIALEAAIAEFKKTSSHFSESEILL